MRPAFIIDAVRTPRAKKKGKYSGIHPADLLTHPLNAITKRNGISPENINDVVIGCVTQTGEQGWCVARASVLAAGWPISVPGTTINRLCGSGQQATNFVAMGIESGHYDIAVSGGLEHMTRVPMFSDAGGEESPLLKKHHPDLVSQGHAAELLAAHYKVSRADIDAFALRSQHRAAAARSAGHFNRSLISIPYKDETGAEQFLTHDDNIRAETSLQALAGLKTAFRENGVITAGNASAIVDGAATVLLASEDAARRFNLRPRARVVSTAVIGSDPLLMLSGPIEASRAALKKAGLTVQDIDLWEINEAFAPVPIITQRELAIDPERVNVSGGGISLGHPLGATGAMLIGTALDELERTSKRYALVTMCIGLGMGIATIIERV
jgi:acetyl-CoA acetyltransferase family protein